jgi:hypothetical protein
MKTDELRKLVDGATPGPWHVYGRDGCAHLLFIGGPSGRQLPVAQIEPIPRKYQGAENKFDNARLIAMAPDLAREVLVLRETARELVSRIAAEKRAKENCDWGEWKDAQHRLEDTLATLRTVLGENE